MKGLIKTYSFDKDYFEIGVAYRLHEKSKPNVYVNALLKGMTDDTLTFITVPKSNTYPTGEIIISISDLWGYCRWEIARLKTDYKDGTFSSEE